MGNGEERCPKFPSMFKAECSHCQGLERGTADNPHFSIKEADDFEGRPVVEVLKNGGPVCWWDEHFRFGLRKAEMLIACMDILWKFWRSTDDERRAFPPQLIEDQTRGLRIQVEMHPDFERSDGTRIYRPCLRLQALPPDNDNTHKGLGATKCQAICAVEVPLKLWLVKQHLKRYLPRLDRSRAEELKQLIDKLSP